MKQRLCAGGLILCLLLSGCTAMLERSYTSVQPYDQTFDWQEGSALEAQNYQQLVSAVLYLVTQHRDSGVIRLYNYTGDVESDLTRACLEVVQKDPLGAFAVDYIKHSAERIVSFYEAQVEITYLRTAEEMEEITAVTGSSAIKRELGDTFSRLKTCLLLRIGYYAEDDAYLYDLVHQAYYDTPSAAFGMPEISISLYPESGVQRIVEIQLSYPADPQLLSSRQEELIAAAEQLLSEAPSQDARSIYDLLLAHTAVSVDGSTAYSALVEGYADPEGFALAYKLLCDKAGVTCTVVRGMDSRTFWNIVSTSSGSRHVDCSYGYFGLTDYQLTQLDQGYLWSDSYPICRDGSELLAE